MESISERYENAHEALMDAREKLSGAKGALNMTRAFASSILPQDFQTPDAFAKASADARSQIQSAEDAVRFWEAKAEKAEKDFQPLEIAALQEEISSSLKARSYALQTLRDVCSGLAGQVQGVRESVALIRETQGEIDRAFETLGKLGARPENPPEDELALLVTRRLENDLGSASGALSAALAIVKHEEGAPQRERERAAFLEKLEQDRKLAYEDECRRGIHGAAERDRAVAEVIEWQRRACGGGTVSPSEKIVMTTSAGAELDIMRRSFALNGGGRR